MTDYSLQLQGIKEAFEKNNWPLYLLRMAKIFTYGDFTLDSIYKNFNALEMFEMYPLARYFLSERPNQPELNISGISFLKPLEGENIVIYIIDQKLHRDTTLLRWYEPEAGSKFIPWEGKYKNSPYCFSIKLKDKTQLFVLKVWDRNSITEDRYNLDIVLGLLIDFLEKECVNKNVTIVNEMIEDLTEFEKEDVIKKTVFEVFELLISKPSLSIKNISFLFRKDEDLQTFNRDLDEIKGYITIDLHIVDNWNKVVGGANRQIRDLFKKYFEKKKVDEEAITFRKKFSPNCDRLDEDFKRLYIIKDRPDTILLLGESGVGKSHLAELIHNESIRKDYPFKEVNCGEFRDILESELFGHKKGAFTGAISEKKGLFESADGGTLFLDDIDEAPIRLQGALLRAIEKKKIRPMGSNEEKEVDVRIIIATNKNIKKLISEDKFLEDFYYRIKRYTIDIPPLREHREDIEPYTLEFIKKRKKSENIEIETKAIDILKNHPLSANVRDLIDIIEGCLVACEIYKVNKITVEMIRDELLKLDIKTTIEFDKFKEILTSYFIKWNQLKNVKQNGLMVCYLVLACR